MVYDKKRLLDLDLTNVKSSVLIHHNLEIPFTAMLPYLHYLYGCTILNCPLSSIVPYPYRFYYLGRYNEQIYFKPVLYPMYRWYHIEVLKDAFYFDEINENCVFIMDTDKCEKSDLCFSPFYLKSIFSQKEKGALKILITDSLDFPDRRLDRPLNQENYWDDITTSSEIIALVLSHFNDNRINVCIESQYLDMILYGHMLQIITGYKIKSFDEIFYSFFEDPGNLNPISLMFTRFVNFSKVDYEVLADLDFVRTFVNFVNNNYRLNNKKKFLKCFEGLLTTIFTKKVPFLNPELTKKQLGEYNFFKMIHDDKNNKIQRLVGGLLYG